MMVDLVNNCTFNKNFAKEYGGAISSHSDIIFTSNSTFIESFAGIGGVIITSAFFHITNSTFSNNTALISGGVTASYGSFYFSDCLFSNNKAQLILGGMFAASNGSYYINRCSFEGGRAGEVGGAIVGKNASFIILNSSFHDNVAKVSGGDMLMSQCSFLIANCSFSDSIYFFNSNTTFGGCMSFKYVTKKITQNLMLPESENQGSAITSFHSQLYFLGNITLENSLSEDGGAILATSSTLWVDGAMHLAYI